MSNVNIYTGFKVVFTDKSKELLQRQILSDPRLDEGLAIINESLQYNSRPSSTKEEIIAKWDVELLLLPLVTKLTWQYIFNKKMYGYLNYDFSLIKYISDYNKPNDYFVLQSCKDIYAGYFYNLNSIVNKDQDYSLFYKFYEFHENFPDIFSEVDDPEVILHYEKPNYRIEEY